EGKIFTDGIKNPKIIFVLNHAGFSQVFMLKGQKLPQSFILFLKKSVELPAYFHIYEADSRLPEALKEAGLDVKVRERQQLRFLSDKPVRAGALPKGYKAYDCNEVGFEKLGVFGLGLDKKFWSSASDFINNAYGKCILGPDRTPVSICYSACISCGISEIDILTLPEYRGKGLARIAAQLFINESIAKGLQPNWDCFSDNAASLRIARSFGFIPLKTYRFLSVSNKTKQGAGYAS
ncbi:MAG: GNAT family N-acetyltransferase, partial [Candidatus Omnitrophica bacterium]|nr:GNAT family N-acetyltransferase [Candidatus Omnitrophota bacterium]